MITQEQLKTLVVGIDKIRYAGANYNYLGYEDMPGGVVMIKIEDEPGHADLLLLGSCTIVKRSKKDRPYFIQSGYCGNVLLWWRQDGAGYTADLNEAGQFTAAFVKRTIRKDEIAWPAEYILGKDVEKTTVIEQQMLDFSKTIPGKKK